MDVSYFDIIYAGRQAFVLFLIQFLVIMNKAAINIQLNVLCEHVFISLGELTRS